MYTPVSCKIDFVAETVDAFVGYVVTQEKSYVWRTSLYLAASASAEFFADIALCPMEAVKVRIQTQPGFATTLREGAPKILHGEGWWGWVQFVLIL